MKPSILLLALAVMAITSCTSAYKTGQTPDDVYFSPQRQQSEYVAANDRNDDPGYYNGDDYYGDRYLRMKVQNRYQWSGLDDYYYNDRYSYGGFGGYSYYNGIYLNNPWSPISYWNYYYNPYYNSYYNPYYSPVFIIGPKGGSTSYTVSNRPRVFNLNTYNNAQVTNGNYTNHRYDINSSPSNVNTNNYNSNYRNSRTSAGSFLRNAFRTNDNYNSNNRNYNSNDNNSRSFNNNSGSSPSSGSRSSGGSSSSGGSAPVRKF
jgi:hypothetical protein